ncbi:MAG: polyprenyl diphosphate synthase [Candidatus Peregrinibacteria bacterium]|nr:polyprenyl diphosphate synthase [Candidatus Peregrinibacteria bacterium]
MSEKPIHLAIIPDGNRRWAKQRLLLPWNGHEKAIENFREITEWCRTNPRISTLTVWCFSTENWNRDPEEIAKLMALLEEYIQRERPKMQEKKTRLAHSGRTDRIPGSLASLIKEVCEESQAYSDFTLHLAIDYGGKDEVLRAVRKIGDCANLTDEKLRSQLDHPELPDIDLVLRTSGEQRTSNFALWQSAYAEWIFLDKFFPDLTVSDLESALTEFNRRTRRFGA